MFVTHTVAGDWTKTSYFMAYYSIQQIMNSYQVIKLATQTLNGKHTYMYTLHRLPRDAISA